MYAAPRLIVRRLTNPLTQRVKLMNLEKLKATLLLSVVGLAFLPGAIAGTYKQITVDGNFADWAGVPVAYTQDPDTTLSIAYTNIYLANDENYLYIRFAISTSDDPFTSRLKDRIVDWNLRSR